MAFDSRIREPSDWIVYADSAWRKLSEEPSPECWIFPSETLLHRYEKTIAGGDGSNPG